MGASVSYEWLWVGLSKFSTIYRSALFWGFYAAYNEWMNILRGVKSQDSANLTKRHSVPSNLFHFYLPFPLFFIPSLVLIYGFFFLFLWMNDICLIAQNGADTKNVYYCDTSGYKVSDICCSSSSLFLQPLRTLRVISGFRILKDGTDRLLRNVGEILPLLAA
jgi:hypothetical protein